RTAQSSPIPDATPGRVLDSRRIRRISAFSANSMRNSLYPDRPAEGSFEDNPRFWGFIYPDLQRAPALGVPWFSFGDRGQRGHCPMGGASLRPLGNPSEVMSGV